MRVRKFGSFAVAAIFAVAIIQTTNMSAASAANGTITFGNPSLNNWYHYAYSVANKTVQLEVAVGGGMGTGKCLTGWFDWSPGPSGGHRDSRANRVCSNGWRYKTPVINESFNVGPPQKLDFCYGLNDTLNSGGSCLDETQTLDEQFFADGDFFNNCVKAWVLTGNGNVSSGGGGLFDTQCSF